jgi:hypothetical protein
LHGEKKSINEQHFKFENKTKIFEAKFFERKSANKNRKILRKKNLRDHFLGATLFVIVTLSSMTIGRIVKKILEFRMNPSLLLNYFCKHL